MEYEQFANKVRAAGLEPRDCGNYHWQIRGGELLVNFYASTKKGDVYYVAGTTRGFRGGVDKAIEATRKVPRVEQYKRDRRRRGGYLRVKRRMMAERNRCHWCNCELTLDHGAISDTLRLATIDHKIPLHRGGLDNANNMVLACEQCNKARGNKMPELEPRRPKR